jgi:hypothetical protein
MYGVEKLLQLQSDAVHGMRLIGMVIFEKRYTWLKDFSKPQMVACTKPPFALARRATKSSH